MKLRKADGTFVVYLALCDFSRGFFEERGPGREKVLFGVLLQATVATAHRAIPRHLRRKPLDSKSASSKPPKIEQMLALNEVKIRQVSRTRSVCSVRDDFLFQILSTASRYPFLSSGQTLALLHRHGPKTHLNMSIL